MHIKTTMRFFGFMFLTLILGDNANSSFWQQVSPAEFSAKLTTKMLMVYFGIDFNQCKRELRTQPKLFTKTYDLQVQATTELVNETFEIIYAELILQKELSKHVLKKKQIKKYVAWLYAVAQSLKELGNFNGVAAIAPVISIYLDYNFVTGKIAKEIKNVDSAEIEKLFAVFIKPHDSQAFERFHQEKDMQFFPNMLTLRKELDFLSSKDFINKYSASDRDSLTLSICSKLSCESFGKYKNFFMLASRK